MMGKAGVDSPATEVCRHDADWLMSVQRSARGAERAAILAMVRERAAECMRHSQAAHRNDHRYIANDWTSRAAELQSMAGYIEVRGKRTEAIVGSDDPNLVAEGGE